MDLAHGIRRGSPQAARLISLRETRADEAVPALRQRHRREIIEIVEARLLVRLDGARVDELADRMARDGLDPFAAADEAMASEAGHE